MLHLHGISVQVLAVTRDGPSKDTSGLVFPSSGARVRPEGWSWPSGSHPQALNPCAGQVGCGVQVGVTVPTAPSALLEALPWPQKNSRRKPLTFHPLHREEK